MTIHPNPVVIETPSYPHPPRPPLVAWSSSEGTFRGKDATEVSGSVRQPKWRTGHQ
jgi:hypothetical protein